MCQNLRSFRPEAQQYFLTKSMLFQYDQNQNQPLKDGALKDHHLPLEMSPAQQTQKENQT